MVPVLVTGTLRRNWQSLPLLRDLWLGRLTCWAQTLQQQSLFACACYFPTGMSSVVRCLTCGQSPDDLEKDLLPEKECKVAWERKARDASGRACSGLHVYQVSSSGSVSEITN